MTPSKTPFPYPLGIGALEHFCRPIPGNVMEEPCWHEGQALAGCSWIALKAHKGHWMPSGCDFKPASAEFVRRFESLPWGSFHHFTTDALNWRNLRDSANLFARGALALWQANGKPAPSPVVRVNECHLVRLSHLQLISRLPRCEVYVGHSTALHFRFSGGVGIIAKDEKLDHASWEILKPQRDCLTGEREIVTRHRAPSLALPGKPWPPPEETGDIVHE